MPSFNPLASVAGNAAALLSPRLSPYRPGLQVAGGRFVTQTDISGQANSLTPIPVVSMGNVKIVRNKFDGASVFVDLFTSYGDTLDTSGMEQIAQGMVEQLKAMSCGGLSLRRLAQMGHPYGRNRLGLMRGKLGRGFGSVAGVRGSAPNLTIINQQRQDGEALANSWGYHVTQVEGGARIELFNTAPESWWVLAGTRKMVAHGPAAFVVAKFRSAILTEWRREATTAYHRQKAQASLATTLGTI